MANIPEGLKGAFRRRPLDANKRSVGTVSVVGGSGHYIHAPVIAGLGARAAGAGLVQLVVPDASRIAAGALVPEATFTKLVATCVPPKADVTVMGMGLGVTVTAEVIVSRLLSGSRGRFVLDADALAVLASWYGRTDGYDPAKGQELVLTPHEGEAAKLLGWERARVSSDRRAAAQEIVDRYGATVVLKGDPFEAAAASVWLHGAASDALVAAGGDPSIVNTAARLGSLRVTLDQEQE